MEKLWNKLSTKHQSLNIIYSVSYKSLVAIYILNFQQAESFYEVANTYRSLMSDELDSEVFDMNG